MLAANIQNTENPSTNHMYQAMLRSSCRNSSELARHVLMNNRVEPLFSSEGTLLGNQHRTELDENRINRIFSTIVRGLHYKKWKQIFPDSYSFVIRSFKQTEYLERLCCMNGHGQLSVVSFDL